MSLRTIDYHDSHHLLNKLLEYESIFKHYGLKTSSPLHHYENTRSIEVENRDEKINVRNLYVTKRKVLEKNESNKKTINAKTIVKKSKQNKSAKKSTPKSEKKKIKPKDSDSVIKIIVPATAKTRKTNYSSSKQLNKNLTSPKIAPSTPVISLHPPSASTNNTVQKLPSFESKAKPSVSNVQASENQLVPRTVSLGAGEPNSMRNLQTREKHFDLMLESEWDLDEINKFTRKIFQNSIHSTDHNTKRRAFRLRLNCPDDSDDHLNKYLQSRSHCLDVFESYVNSLKRQHGIVPNAASDQPLFDPGISITGPHVKSDTSTIDKEDSAAIKKLISLEPRKKYALVHEQIGIFMIGGYNLHVDIPVQKEPKTDYLFKSNGDIVKIPPLNPCRVHFGIYTDGDAIYIAGGQTIQNELLDDIQCLNLKKLKWEYITTLINPIAACGMTLDNKRIYLVGGYDILQNHTVLLTDYTIYNLTTRQFEKSIDLPSPRCRSLIFATDHAIFCVSGLTEGYDANNNKKMKISTDILKWMTDKSNWIKVSQTPTLTKFHALSFNEPYLEITKRLFDSQPDGQDTTTEAYYDFRTNTWTNGKAPTSTSPTESKPIPSTPKKSGKSIIKSSPNTTKTSKVKSPSKSKEKKSNVKNKPKKK